MSLLGTATLTAGGDNSSTAFSGVMSGTGGFTKEGTGLVFFTGTNSYNGATTVNDGTLLVNGALTSSATTINANGVFGGLGQVGAVHVNGGVFAPGSGAPGTQMTVNGNLDFAGGGTFLVFADPATVSSAMINGAANLSGGLVQALFAPGSYVTRQYTILSASGGLGGTQFAGVTGNPAGFRTTLAYQGNDVVLNLIGQLGVDGTLSVNQQNVATSLNRYFNNGGTLPPAFVTLFGLTGDALRHALRQASGESGASISQSTFLAWNQFFNMMFDPFAGGRSGMNGQGALPFAAHANAQTDDVRLAYAAVTPKGAPAHGDQGTACAAGV